MPGSTTPAAADLSRPRRKWPLWSLCAGLAVVLLATGLYFANKYWPYRYRNVKPLLESVFASNLQINHYHRTYFPHPGFVADELTLRRNSALNQPPIGTTRKLIVQGSWHDLLLLRNRVQLVDVVDLHVTIPPVGSQANHEDFPPGSSADFAGPATVVEVFRIHHATLDIIRTNGSRYSYPIDTLTIHNLQSGRAISYDVEMQNAVPTGRLHATGSFGPLTPRNLGGTPVSGNFTFSRVNLNEIGDLRGTLSSRGHFSGALDAIETYATAETPDFAVGTGRRTPITGSAQCTIDALNGGVVLHRVDLTDGATLIHVQGASLGSQRVTDLDIAVAKGRAQDLLRPFLESQVPLAGVVWLKGHAHIAPSQGATFLRRLSVDGSFDVPAERLTNRATERTLTAFSQRAQGGKPSKGDAPPGDPSPSATDVLSSIEGRVSIRDGVVSSDRLRFAVPGAATDLRGSYNLKNDNVHLAGDLRMEANVSHVTTGFKSLLLKPFIPFFKRDHAGAVIPIAVTGGPGSYKVSQNLLHDK